MAPLFSLSSSSGEQAGRAERVVYFNCPEKDYLRDSTLYDRSNFCG
jgi:hypothetical protein